MLDPITLGVIGGGANVLGGLLGGLFSSGDQDAAMAAMQDAYDEIMNLPEGPDLARPILLQKLNRAGLLTPEVENQINLQSDKIQTLVENPEMRNRQTAQLGALEQLAKTGFGAEDRLAQLKLKNSLAGDLNAQFEQMKQRAAMTGQNIFGGANLALMANARQNAAQNSNERGAQIAANAASARRNAIMQAAGLAGDIRNQDTSTDKFNIDNERLRREFIDRNSMGREERRVANANDANRFNTQRQQTVSDTNVGNENEELRRQRIAENQMYQNTLARSGMRQSARQGMANQHMGQAQNTQQMWANIGGGAGDIFGTMAQAKLLKGKKA